MASLKRWLFHSVWLCYAACATREEFPAPAPNRSESLAPLGALKQAPLAVFTPDATYAVDSYPRYPAALPAGNGRDKVNTYCIVCHSPTYMTAQPALGTATWHKEVEKMIDGYGAQVPAAEIDGIVAYLAEYMGKQGEAPAAPSGGDVVYQQTCMMCHQASGSGVPGAFPPLAGHVPELAREGSQGRTYLVNMVLYGVMGPIEVSGKSYSNVMPALGPHLTDAQVAQVLNYVAGAWGNGKTLGASWKPYIAEEIAALRGSELNPQQVFAQRPR